MSIKAVAAALELPLEPLPKILLITLADHHNGSTGRCDPSQGRLAQVARVSVRTVRSHLKILEEAGWISRQHLTRPNGSRTNDSYNLLFLGAEESAGRAETDQVKQDAHRKPDVSTTGSKPGVPAEAQASGPKPEEPEKNRKNIYERAETLSMTLLTEEPEKVDPARDVFDHWRQVIPGKQKSKWSLPRQSAIRKALDSWSVADLKKAIDGFFLDDFRMCRGDRAGQRIWDDVIYIVRNEGFVEQFIALADNPPTPIASKKVKPEYADAW
jgi:hypothetical protein